MNIKEKISEFFNRKENEKVDESKHVGCCGSCSDKPKEKKQEENKKIEED